MKKISILFTLFLLLFNHTVWSQLYDQVFNTMNKKPDADNQIFLPGQVFTYSVESDLELPQQIIYTVVDLPKSKRTNKNQTEVVISYMPDQRKYENTGIIDNPFNIWLHPPRTGDFNILETCPFPYVKFPLEDDKAWEDQLLVDEQWSQGMWKGYMLFDIKYQIVGKRQFEVDNIKYDCWLIKSTATSKVGNSELMAIYHEDEGFMELKYKTLKDQQVVLKLESIIQGPIYRNMKDYFSDKLTQSK